jgi:hypothetical protein
MEEGGGKREEGGGMGRRKEGEGEEGGGRFKKETHSIKFVPFHDVASMLSCVIFPTSYHSFPQRDFMCVVINASLRHSAGVRVYVLSFLLNNQTLQSLCDCYRALVDQPHTTGSCTVLKMRSVRC